MPPFFDQWLCMRYRTLRPLVFLIPCVALPLLWGAAWQSAVSVVAGILLFAGFVWRYQPRHYEPAWRRVAQRLALDFVPRQGKRGAFVQGRVNGRFLTLTAHNPLPGWKQTSQTVIVVELKQTRYRFNFYTASRHERDARAVLGRDGGLGIAELDAHFVFQYEETASAAPLFDEALARRFARIGGASAQQRITVEPQRLAYRASSILLNPDSLVFLIELMVALADRVEASVVTPPP